MHMFFHYFAKKVKVILWSIRTFWYKGLAKTMKNDKFEKKASILKKIIVCMKKRFFKKVFIWYLEVNIE